MYFWSDTSIHNTYKDLVLQWKHMAFVFFFSDKIEELLKQIEGRTECNSIHSVVLHQFKQKWA